MDRRWLRRVAPPLLDWLLAFGLVAMGVTLAVGNSRFLAELVDDLDPPSDLVIAASVAVAVAPVAFRRVFPLGSLLAITVGMLLMAVYGVIEITATNVASFVGLVSAGIYGRAAYRDWTRGLFAVAILLLFVALFISRSGFNSAHISPRLMVAVAGAEFAANAGFVALGWYLGDLERRRRAMAGELAERNTELASALATVDAQAGNEERLAIAREVHDIVGHTVSLLGVQAAAARRQITRDTDGAEAMLLTMEEQSRRSVDEIRSLIAVLRGPAGDGDEARATPTPSIDQLDDLIEDVRGSGTEVTYRRAGTLPDATGLGLSIYRVVQEALSNAIRHGDGDVEVVVTGDDADVRVFVSNRLSREDRVNGRRPRAGSGLAGMRERVALHGGTLVADRRADGRYEVQAVFPVGSPRPADAVGAEVR